MARRWNPIAPLKATGSARRAADAIASGVGRALGATDAAGDISGWPRGDEAFEAMAAGDYAMLSPTVAGADSAVRAYEHAYELEPRAIAATTRLARAYVILLGRGGTPPELSSAQVIARVEELASQALRGDSNASTAWTVRAMAARLADPVAFKGAIGFHRRAIAADRTDADAEHEYGVTLMRLGEDHEARAHFTRALSLEPNRASSLAALAAIELRAEHWNEACAFSNASIAAWSYDPMPYAVRARARMHLAQARDAFSDAELSARLGGSGAWSAALRVLMQRDAGNIEASNAGARSMTARWLAREQTLGVRDAVYLALMYQAVGDTRRAIESLRRARPLGADLRRGIGEPRLAPIRSDTAVVRILRESRSGGGQ
jgi:tetratricopeptide (TPR) repeat protein